MRGTQVEAVRENHDRPLPWRSGFGNEGICPPPDATTMADASVLHVSSDPLIRESVCSEFVYARNPYRWGYRGPYVPEGRLMLHSDRDETSAVTEAAIPLGAKSRSIPLIR